MKIKEMPVGQATLPLLVVSIADKTTKNGDGFCTLTLSDGQTQINANMFRVTSEVIQEHLGTVANVSLSYDGVYYNVNKLTKNATADVKDFVIHAPLDSEAMFGSIINVLQKSERGLAKLALKLYQENKDRLIYWSAAKSIHHNFYGGLLYHTYRMMQTASRITKIYPILDHELLLIGCALHDIGKLYELETSSFGSASYTPDGQLFGHSLIGIEMIRDAAATMDVDAEDLKLLTHMIASHHGNLEWGAITNPATPEALALHLIDLLDSHMYIFENTLQEQTPGSLSTPVYALNNACLYKRN